MWISSFCIFRLLKVRRFWQKILSETFRFPVWLRVKPVCSFVPDLWLKTKAADREMYDTPERLNMFTQKLFWNDSKLIYMTFCEPVLVSCYKINYKIGHRHLQLSLSIHFLVISLIALIHLLIKNETEILALTYIVHTLFRLIHQPVLTQSWSATDQMSNLMAKYLPTRLETEN